MISAPFGEMRIQISPLYIKVFGTLLVYLQQYSMVQFFWKFIWMTKHQLISIYSLINSAKMTFLQ